MAFTYADVLAAKRSWRVEEVATAVEQAPVGYQAGGRVGYANNNFLVDPFVINVNGHMVVQKTQTPVAGEDWGLQLRAPGHYYFLYVGRGGGFSVTVDRPQWEESLMAWYHPFSGERLLGTCFLDVLDLDDAERSGEMIYASSHLVIDTHEVTVVASDYVGEDYDYRCDGVADEVEINHAIRYMARSKGKDIDGNELPGGGIVRLSPGTFNLSAPIDLLSNVLLEGSGKATVLDPAASVSAIEATGSDGSEIVGSEIRDLKIKRSAAPSYPGGSDATNYLDDIDLNYADRFVVSSVECDDDVARANSDPGANIWSYAAIRAGNCDDLAVRGCALQIGICGIALDSCSGLVEANNIWMSGQADKSSVSGIIVQNGAKFRVEGNKVTDLLVGTGSRDVFGIQVPAGSGCVIKNNIVENIRRPAGGADRTYGILAAGNTTPSIISGNIVRVIQNWSAPGPGSDNQIAGISVLESHDTMVNDNHIEDADVGVWVESVTRRVSFSGNDVINCGQLIDYGSCEDANEPMVLGETVPANINCSWARSSEQAYEGTYSYKMTVTSGGSGSRAAFVDGTGTSDLHGLLPGTEYTLEAWIYVPSPGGPAASEVHLILNDYHGGSWGKVDEEPTSTGAWEKVTVTMTADPAATAITAYIDIDSSAASNEYIYVDNVRLYPTKSQNAHDNLLKDEGTDTRF